MFIETVTFFKYDIYILYLKSLFCKNFYIYKDMFVDLVKYFENNTKCNKVFKYLTLWTSLILKILFCFITDNKKKIKLKCQVNKTICFLNSDKVLKLKTIYTLL